MEKQGTKLVPAGFEFLFLGEVKTWAKENGETHPSDCAWWHYQMYLENRKLHLWCSTNIQPVENGGMGGKAFLHPCISD